MKRLLINLMVLSLTLSACGNLSDTSTQVSEDSASRGAVQTPAGKSFNQIESSITGQLPSIASQALQRLAEKGIVPATCPSGMDKSCADALFLALVNTRAIKSMALTAQTSILGNLSGTSFNLYAGLARQPAINSGFAISKSTFYTQAKSSSNPWTLAVGELLLTNTQSLQAGIAAYTFLTNKTSAIGIAGGYAGASLSGWTEGVFYCYLVVSGGVPVGLCDAAAYSGGW